MPPRSNIFRDPVPTDPRLAVELPCVLCHDPSRGAATVRNINHTGLQITLPGESSGEAFKDPRSVEITGIGTFDVAVVWRRYGRLGLKFTDRQAARGLLDAYFDATGTCP